MAMLLVTRRPQNLRLTKNKEPRLRNGWPTTFPMRRPAERLSMFPLRRWISRSVSRLSLIRKRQNSSVPLILKTLWTSKRIW